MVWGLILFLVWVDEMKPEILIALGTFLLSLVPYALGMVLWYAKNEQRKYASQRDFDHLRNNQKEISNGIAHLMDDMDRHFEIINRDILEIKIKLNIHDFHE